MPGEKRFGTSLFGFRKTDVNAYIEKILGEFDSRLREKEDEITALKAQNREIRLKHEELLKKTDLIVEDRTKIADVLIKAQEKAEQLLEDARREALAEKKRLEEEIEQEKEKLVDIKREVKLLKSGLISTLRNYDSQLDNLVKEEAG